MVLSSLRERDCAASRMEAPNAAIRPSRRKTTPGAPAECRGPLLFKINWRAANSLAFQIDRYFHAIGDLDERYTAVHAELFTIERHRSRNRTGASSFSRDRKHQLFLLGHSADCKVAVKLDRSRASLRDRRRVKRDQRVLRHIEKVLTLQLAVFHAAACIHAGRLNLDIQHRCR